MRVTNRTMTNNLLLNLNRGMGRLERINSQLGTKKQINLPSDDPVKVGIILRMQGSVRETEQYLRNSDSAVSWLEASDVVCKDVLAVIHRAKELAARGASTHLEATSKQALADEVYQLHDNLLQLANSTHGGRYLFAGQHTAGQIDPVPGTREAPFTTEARGPELIPDVEYLKHVPAAQRQERALKFEIGVNVTMDVNLDGEELFSGIFKALQTLHDDLTGAAPAGAPPATPLRDLDGALDNVLRRVSELGGKQNRVDLARERLQDLRLNVKKILSEEQDLDYAEAIMDLKMEEFAYRTALSVGARIIQPSLIDFLR